MTIDRKRALIDAELKDRDALFAFWDEQLSYCDLTDPYDAKLAAILILARDTQSIHSYDTP